MAHFETSFQQGVNNPPPYAQNVQQMRQNQGFIVVDQQPPTRSERFPYSLPIKCIFGFSIAECVIALVMINMGIVNIAADVNHLNTYIAFPIWCGLTILANGIIGCVLKWKQSKCLVGAYLGLSITSLVLTVVMLGFYLLALYYFVDIGYANCSFHPDYLCLKIVPIKRDEDLGLTSALVVLMICEFACSIASVALSCKAYSKCCNTCNADDCCTCLGCCKCDTTPLTYQQWDQYNKPSIQMPSFPQSNIAHNPNQANVNMNPPSAGWQNNPCSGLMSFVVNFPASLFGSGNENAAQPGSLNLSIQLGAVNNQQSASNAQQI